MKSMLYLSFFLCFITCKKNEQPNVDDTKNFENLIELPDAINESSGMLLKDDATVYTHNDSGNDPIIFHVNITNGNILQENVLLADNNDWEELAEDDTFIYVGDFGNNNGARTNLSIIKIPRASIESNSTELSSERINFSYPEQMEFTPRTSHNFDCEAMISVGDHLYLFTKNRENEKTDLYRLPKNPGNYNAERITTFDSGGLITAATMRKTEQPAIALLGYEQKDGGFAPFIWLLYDFTTPDFFGGKTQRIEVPYRVQAEAICFENKTQLLFTAEEEVGQAGLIYRFDAREWLN